MSWRHSVKFKAYCPYCGSLLSSFETKEGPNDIRNENICEYWEAKDFFDSCDKCERIVTYELNPHWNPRFDGKTKIPISFYRISMSIKYDESFAKE